MQYSHAALWTTDLERSRQFYMKWFNGQSNEKYINASKGFASYFITFKGGVSLEIMQRTDVTAVVPEPHIGLIHIAFTAGSKECVDESIERFRKAGYTVAGEPRYTGDGYYEGSILDPDGVLVELVAFREIDILPVTANYPYDLLLLADPEKDKINAYLSSSACFVAVYNNVTAGVIVVQKQTDNRAEIMNIAVDENYQRRGIARKLLRYISEELAPANHIERLIIRTGTSAPAPLMLYQQEGFQITDIQYDYFVRNYKEPIFENGIQCRHQIILEKRIAN